MTRSCRANRSRIRFQGQYLRFSNRMPRANSSPPTIVAWAAIQEPVTWPRASHGAIFTTPVRRMRFALPEVRGGIDIELRAAGFGRCGGEPDRRPDAPAGFAVGFKVQIPLAVKRIQSPPGCSSSGSCPIARGRLHGVWSMIAVAERSAEATYTTFVLGVLETLRASGQASMGWGSRGTLRRRAPVVAIAGRLASVGGRSTARPLAGAPAHWFRGLAVHRAGVRRCCSTAS